MAGAKEGRKCGEEIYINISVHSLTHILPPASCMPACLPLTSSLTHLFTYSLTVYLVYSKNKKIIYVSQTDREIDRPISILPPHQPQDFGHVFRVFSSKSMQY